MVGGAGWLVGAHSGTDIISRRAVRLAGLRHRRRQARSIYTPLGAAAPPLPRLAGWLRWSAGLWPRLVGWLRRLVGRRRAHGEGNLTWVDVLVHAVHCLRMLFYRDNSPATNKHTVSACFVNVEFRYTTCDSSQLSTQCVCVFLIMRIYTHIYICIYVCIKFLHVYVYISILTEDTFARPYSTHINNMIALVA